MNRHQYRATALAVAAVALATATSQAAQAQPQTVQQCQAVWRQNMNSGLAALDQTIGVQNGIGAKLDANNCRDPAQAMTMACLHLSEASLLALGNIRMATSLLGFSSMAYNYCPQAVADAAAKAEACVGLRQAYDGFKRAAEVSWAPSTWVSGGEEIAAMKKTRNEMVAMGCPNIP
ncbi:hypothetical protein [Phenylobacterium sp.]|uniref:hypothetical protein n=1 Tax=Phenylobacterium sp. TaxID=1871053 RepID=UPI002CADAFBD|nr:hypothetical protein [Phenylobacterium sp.]HVI31837.1 hypothetical protein [Phenylobacterium sp.]